MSVTLGLKLGRRLVAAAGLDEDGQFVFHDSRYVDGRKSTLNAGTTRYFGQLLDQLKPAAVYYYAPTGHQTLTEQLALLLEQSAVHAGISAHRLTKADLFGSVSVTPARTRRELQEQLADLWPALSEAKVHRQAALAEASASALVGDLRQELPPP
jgi:hypothetical protein